MTSVSLMTSNLSPIERVIVTVKAEFVSVKLVSDPLVNPSAGTDSKSKTIKSAEVDVGANELNAKINKQTVHAFGRQARNLTVTEKKRSLILT